VVSVSERYQGIADHLMVWNIDGTMSQKISVQYVGVLIAVDNSCRILFSVKDKGSFPCVLRAFDTQSGEVLTVVNFESPFTGDRLFYDEQTNTLSGAIDGKAALFRCMEAAGLHEARIAKTIEKARQYYDQGQYLEAALEYSITAAAYRQIIDGEKTAMRLHMLAHLETMAGVCYTFINNSEKAVEFQLASIAHYEELSLEDRKKHENDLSISYTNIANQYAKTDTQKAIDYYGKCLAICEQYKDQDSSWKQQYDTAKEQIEKLQK
jgi:tetratricopeptide (TPR) repeat protein